MSNRPRCTSLREIPSKKISIVGYKNHSTSFRQTNRNENPPRNQNTLNVQNISVIPNEAPGINPDIHPENKLNFNHAEFHPNYPNVLFTNSKHLKKVEKQRQRKEFIQNLKQSVKSLGSFQFLKRKKSKN